MDLCPWQCGKDLILILFEDLLDFWHQLLLGFLVWPFGGLCQGINWLQRFCLHLVKGDRDSGLLVFSVCLFWVQINLESIPTGKRTTLWCGSLSFCVYAWPMTDFLELSYIFSFTLWVFVYHSERPILPLIVWTCNISYLHMELSNLVIRSPSGVLFWWA